jgi:hypothetical protein
MNHSIDPVTSLRASLWRAGYRPVPVFNANHTGINSPGKQPLGDKWQLHARMNPPFCVISQAVPHALNTGVLADGLRPLDLDIDDPEKARECRAVASRMFGPIPTRSRCDTARVLLLCRAAEGEPLKRTLTGRSHTTEHSCKIEVLGRGQQFVAFGRHPSGADLKWSPDSPGVLQYDELPEVTEDDIQAFLEACAPIIDAPVPSRPNGHDHTSADPQAESLRIAAALASISNHGPADWEGWNRVGMAVWRATDGSSAGWEAFNAWSQRNQAYNADATRTRWDHYTTSPPTSIGAGTIFHMAAEGAGRPFVDPDDPGPTDKPTPDGPKPERPDFNPAVADFLSATTWANLKIKPEHRLLGDFITSSTRAWLAGSTGSGKTMSTYAMVGGMASGRGYLHWKTYGARNVRAELERTSTMSPREEKSLRQKIRKALLTDEAMVRFLDDQFGRGNYTYDPEADLWVAADRDRGGAGRGFILMRRGGLWRRIVLSGSAIQ